MDKGRKADGAAVPDLRRCSLSRAGVGEGESSMMRTHPDVLPIGVVVGSLKSTLGRLDFIVIVFSGERERTDDLVLETDAVRAEEGPAFGGGGGATGGVEVPETTRLLTLPMRILGTRVWIFWPSTSTRARISDSI